MCIGWSYTVDQIAEAAAHLRCSPSSDATTFSPGGPWPDHVFHGAFSWAAWYLETVVRERGALIAGGSGPAPDRPARYADRSDDRVSRRVGARQYLPSSIPAAFAPRQPFEAPTG